MSEPRRLACLADVPPNTLLGVEVDEIRICLANADGKIYAFQDNCTHKDFPMAAGSVHGGATIECAWHGARFDMATGKAIRLPAIKPLKTYEVTLDGDDILVAV
ncbi:MAG: non-heme iron oxygenase ferredoxin subunit [Longimicrobiales bacterium]